MIEIFTPDNNIVTQWSGGQTNQLYIWPAGADFKSGNFLVRLSTASVEIEESTFTQLPEVDRTLIVLEGKIKLTHEHHHQKELLPYDMDHFSGSWNTHSKGKCIDFNLMTKGNVSSEVSILDIKPSEQFHYQLDGDQVYFYTHDTSVKIDYNGSHELNNRSIATIKSKFLKPSIKIESTNHCKLIAIQVKFN